MTIRKDQRWRLADSNYVPARPQVLTIRGIQPGYTNPRRAIVETQSVGPLTELYYLPASVFAQQLYVRDDARPLVIDIYGIYG